jgi:tetratricopeptide (TPR) repeat protein
MKCTRCGNRLVVGPPTADLGSLDGLDLPDPSQADDGISIGALADDVVDLPTPKGAAPRRGFPQEEAPDLLAPVGATPPARKKDLDDPDLVAPVGPMPTRAMPAASALPKAPSMPAPPIGAPRKTSIAPPPLKTKAPVDADLPDLLAPVGPKPQREITDLLAPVGPKPQREITDLLAPVGPKPQKDITDLLAPVGPKSQKDLPDLLAPVGPKPQRDLPDLLAPVGPRPQKDITDLLAPKGAPPRQPLSDDDLLMTPVGPVPQRSSPDLLEPVGPVPTRGKEDLLTPVGPQAVRNAPGLLTPVGPQPVRNAPDLLEPVGPVPTRGKEDLLTPVGPQPIRNAPGLLTPVGPNPIRNGPDLLEPVGPVPTRGLDLPAPQGFFDDVPPPTPRSPFATGAPLSSPLTLNLDDDLDVVPIGEPSQSGPAPLDLFAEDDRLSTRPSGEGGLDGLDLPPPDAGGTGYGEVELPPAADELAGVVSFNKTGAAEAPKRGSVSLSPEPVPVARVDPKVGRAAPTPTKPPVTKEQRARRNRWLGLGIGLALVGGGGFYAYQNVDFEVSGFRSAPAQERADRISAGLASMHKLMMGDERGHWDQAIAAGKRVLALQPGNPDALATSAQAQIAAYLDEGSNLAQRKKAADDLIGELVKTSAKGNEVEKAQALRSTLDEGRGEEAKKALAALSQRAPKDADLALYLGWAAQAGGDWKTAAAAFARAGDRMPALYGLGRAQLALGERDKARATFEQVIAKQPDKKHIGAWVGLVEIQTKPGEKNREDELAAICEKAPERLTAHPHDLSRAWTLYADEAVLGQRFEIAVERYRQARKLDESNLTAMVGSALASVEVHEQGGGKANLVEARRELEKAIQLQPGAESIPALVGLTRINLAEGKVMEARATIEKAVKLDEKSAVAQLWLGRVLADNSINEINGAQGAFRRAMTLAPRDFAAYVALAQLLGKRGDTKGALAVLAPIADASKKDPPLANALGMAYVGARDFAAAEASFRTALSVDPELAEARLNLADTLVAQGRYADAVAEYQKLLKNEPAREDVSLRLGTTFERMRKFGDAEKIFQKLLSTDGGNVPSVRARAAAGRFWARQKKWELVSEQEKLLFAADPRQPTAFFLRGAVELSEGKLDEAMKDLTEAITLEPQAEYHETMGRLYEEKKDIGAAMGQYNAALAMDNALAGAHAGLGRMHLERHDWDSALASLQRATQLDDYDAALWEGIGDAYVGQKDPVKALEAYDKSTDRDAKRGSVFFKMGKIYYQNDDGARAISYLETAVGLGPADAPWIAEAYRLLAQRHRASGNTAKGCDAFRQYDKHAAPNDKLRGELKKLFLSCP